jgi:glutaminase
MMRLKLLRRSCAPAVLWLLSCAATAGDGERIQQALDRAYERFANVQDGENAQYIPALAAADRDAFGLVAITVEGEVLARGNADQVFAIMSAAKPFTLSLLMNQQGPDTVVKKIGVEPTGLPFNALAGIDRTGNPPMNPMVNAGAITTVSLLEVDKPEQRWPMILDYYSRFAGESLTMIEAVYESVGSSNYHNRALVNLLQSERWLGAPPAHTLDVYNRQSCVGVTAKQLAAMGATLANSGVNPLTGERVLNGEYVDEILSIMLLSGFYDESGRWAFDAGIPAKSGVGGGIVAVVPGRMALAAFSPPLSPAGNSVRGMLAIKMISEELELGMFNP